MKKEYATIAFDFDETLYNETKNGYEPNKDVLKLLHNLHEDGHRIVVVTARNEPGTEPNSRFYQKVAKGLLPRVDFFIDKHISFDIDVYYTNQELKVSKLLELDVDILIDDREIERMAAQCEGIATYDPRFIKAL